MTAWQRSALCCRMAALAAALGAGWLATRDYWVPAGALGWGVLMLAFLGGRCHKAHLTDQATNERARRAARADSLILAEPVPCCSFWKHSDGEVHGPDCTRPPEARYVRAPRPRQEDEAAAFEEIIARLGDGSAS